MTKDSDLITIHQNVIPALSLSSYGLFSCHENQWIESHSVNFDPIYHQGEHYLRRLIKGELIKSREAGWKEDGITAILAIDQGLGNYYHFLVNQLPFIAYAHQLQTGADYIILNNDKRFMAEYLRLLKIDQKIISIRNKALRLSSCVTSNQYLPASKFAGHQSLIEIGHKINEAFEAKNLNFQARSDKVFIERKSSSNDSGLRKVYPVKEFHSWLIDNNFSILYMEDLGIEEQIHIFKTSRVIAAVHGAALTNMIFCKSDTVVIEIHHEDPRAVTFHDIAERMEIKNYTKVACPGFLSEEKENKLRGLTGNSINALPLRCNKELLEVLSSC